MSDRELLDEVELGISQENVVPIMVILRDKLYSDKIGAVVREYSCNAMDAHIHAGKPDVPIRVTLPTKKGDIFSVRDYGRGLSADEVKNIYFSYAASTKRGDNTVTGKLGLGSKSAFAYTTEFTVTSFKEGKAYAYLVARMGDNDAGRAILTSVRDCPKEKDGVEVSVQVHTNDDARRFTHKALKLFEFWSKPLPVVKMTDGTTPELKSVWEKGEWTVANSEENSALEWIMIRAIRSWGIPEGLRARGQGSRIVIVMANVPYEASLKHLDDGDIPPVFQQDTSTLTVLKAPNGMVDFSASREELEYTKKTTTFIASALKTIIEEIETGWARHAEEIERFEHLTRLCSGLPGRIWMRLAAEGQLTWHGHKLEMGWLRALSSQCLGVVPHGRLPGYSSDEESEERKAWDEWQNRLASLPQKLTAFVGNDRGYGKIIVTRGWERKLRDRPIYIPLPSGGSDKKVLVVSTGGKPYAARCRHFLEQHSDYWTVAPTALRKDEKLIKACGAHLLEWKNIEDLPLPERDKKSGSGKRRKTTDLEAKHRKKLSKKVYVFWERSFEDIDNTLPARVSENRRAYIRSLAMRPRGSQHWHPLEEHQKLIEDKDTKILWVTIDRFRPVLPRYFMVNIVTFLSSYEQWTGENLLPELVLGVRDKDEGQIEKLKKEGYKIESVSEFITRVTGQRHLMEQLALGGLGRALVGIGPSMHRSMLNMIIMPPGSSSPSLEKMAATGLFSTRRIQPETENQIALMRKIQTLAQCITRRRCDTTDTRSLQALDPSDEEEIIKGLKRQKDTLWEDTRVVRLGKTARGLIHLARECVASHEAASAAVDLILHSGKEGQVRKVYEQALGQVADTLKEITDQLKGDYTYVTGRVPLLDEALPVEASWGDRAGHYTAVLGLLRATLEHTVVQETEEEE